MDSEWKPSISITQFYTGKTVFVTGATGFMGKVLLEKLLRSCPDLSKIYILVRPKKGKSPEERVKAITDFALFDVLKKENPENLKKIIPVSGDVTELELGLSVEDKQMLIDQVHIVYHVAASVRFDDPLTDAIIMNTRGTREVINLAKQMKHLEVLLHTSTSYCHTDKKVIEEKIYEPHADWREAIKIAETVDRHVLDVMTQKYLNPLPNTYTFTKSLAEHVVTDLCDGNLPTVIFRPSIVISSLSDPMPGWIDNFNGPVGILVASGKGILRSVLTKPDLTADYIPVDIVIKALIVTTWLKALEKDKEAKYKVSVYNASNNNVNNITLGSLVELGKRLCWEYPLNNVIWYPDCRVTQCRFNHYLKLIFYHLLPALFIDGLLKMVGQKPMLLRVQRKIYIANIALQYFITQEWDIVNEKALHLEKKLLPEDVQAFSYGSTNIDAYEFFKKGLMGSRQFLLKEDISSFEQAKIHSRRMWVLSKIFNIAWYATIFYFIFFRYNCLNLLYKLQNVFVVDH